MDRTVFIDQVLSGFDRSLKDFGTAAFIKKRRDVIHDPDTYYMLEFMEVSVDTYENLVYHRKGKLDNTHRNILLWTDPHTPNSYSYWSQSEFAELVMLLKKGGVERIMVRTFFTFEGKTGHGRFLRNDNTPHTKAFEWRRADEFNRRHPEFRESESCLINWDQLLTADPLYDIKEGQTAGKWFLKKLFDLFSDLGVDAVRFGDGSFGGSLKRVMQDSKREFTLLNRAVHNEALKHGILFMTSLGPYWHFDYWHNDQGIEFHDLASISDLVLTQPFDGWSDKYGITYTHNGDYFTSGSSVVHSLVNAAVTPGASFIRGLDSGDIIENWFPAPEMPLRQTLESLTLYSRQGDDLTPAYRGVYHFWSDVLERDYYRSQQKLISFLKANCPVSMEGPELVVTDGQKPHNYIMGDFFEACGFGMRVSTLSADIRPVSGHTYVYWLPRLKGEAALLGEEEMSESDSETLEQLLESEADIMIFGGTRSSRLLDAFGVSYANQDFSPWRWECDGEQGIWNDRTVRDDQAGMAGTPEKYKRHDSLKFTAAGADVLAYAVDADSHQRLLVSIKKAKGMGRRIFITSPIDEVSRKCASRIFSQTGSYSYQVSSDAAVTSFSWSTASAEKYLCIMRYDAWHAEEMPVSISGISRLNLRLSSAADYLKGELRLKPQGFAVFKCG